MHEKFDAWLKRSEDSDREFEKRKTQTQSSSFSSNNEPNRNSLKQGSNSERNGLVSPVQQRFKLQRPDNSEKFNRESVKEENSNFLKELPSFNAIERPKHLVMPKTRIRTSFDPELELPKLHKWYLENPHPSRQQVKQLPLSFHYIYIYIYHILIKNLLVVKIKNSLKHKNEEK